MSGKPWYHGGLRFRCTGCGDCCTGEPGYVWVNKSEIEAMAAALGVEVAVFEQRYVRRVGARKSLMELANGDCVFLDRHKRVCQLYTVRPLQCRTWPFWASNVRTPAAWEEVCARCPGVNRGHLFSLEAIQHRLKMPAD